MSSMPSSIPSQVSQATSETLPWKFDVTKLLQVGDTVTSPTSVFTDLTIGSDIVLPDLPAASGNVVTQIVNGSVLTAGHQYRLVVSFVANAFTTWSVPLLLTVPF